MVDRRIRKPIVDRQKTCPFLLRVFVKSGLHHDTNRDFRVPDRLPVLDEQPIHAWKDTTLRDICLQLMNSNQSLKNNPPLKFSLRLVFLDSPRDLPLGVDGPITRYKSQDLGVVFSRDLARPASAAPINSLRSLEEIRFSVGDFIDVALVSTHLPGPGPAPSSLDVRPRLGIRGAARGLATGSAPLDNSRWNRSNVPPRWGPSSDRRTSGGFEPPRPDDNGRWGHNPTNRPQRANGSIQRENDRNRDRVTPKRRRANSRSRSPSLARRNSRR